MFGNLLNNTLIRELVDAREIMITPRFNPARLQIAQYPLFPFAVHSVSAPNKIKREYLFGEDGNTYTLTPDQYVVIDILELIQLPIGIVGRFIPASSIIERGLSLTAGKLEHPFCHNGERIRFGLKNLLSCPNLLKADEQIAYIEFFDLRGMDNFDYKLNRRDKKVYKERVDPDADAPNYEKDN